VPLYTLGRFFCSERSTDISSTVYLIPNRQHQHSLISLRYMKLIAVRTREDHHCRRCHHRRASIVTLIIARAFNLSRALPIRSKRKRGGIIIVITIVVVTFAPRKSPPTATRVSCIRSTIRRKRERGGKGRGEEICTRYDIPDYFMFKL